jgi:uncharacterized protein YndB with AHSA1/START domain
MDDLTVDAPANEPVVKVSRTFKAPRALVWKALSEPEHVVRWWGPHGYENRAVTFEFRPGGKWRIETTMPEGEVIVFYGEYREIVKPERIQQTFGFEPMPPDVYSIDTTTLEERNGETIYRTISVLPDMAARDGLLASGMEIGVREGFERLDAMLEEWKALA